jgi:small GTP-binding protein
MTKTYKILIVGEGAVGKTSIATRYTTGAFKESHLLTIGANFMLKNLEMEDGTTIRLNIWDTAGQEKFRKVVESYYKGGRGVLITFDITNKKSFDEISYWYETAKIQVPDAVYILVGNKSDLADKRVISEIEAIDLANKWNISYIETSAKLNQNINEVFNKLTEKMVGQ